MHNNDGDDDDECINVRLSAATTSIENSDRHDEFILLEKQIKISDILNCCCCELQNLWNSNEMCSNAVPPQQNTTTHLKLFKKQNYEN